MKKLIIILVLILSFQACKKDKLIGDKAIFVGEWEWIKTSHTYGWCDGDNFSEVLTPLTENTSYSVEFLKKGIVKYYENGNYLNKNRLVFIDFSDCDWVGYKSFDIYLNNKEEYVYYGCLNEDTLIINKGFPFENYELGCEAYISYFVKQ